MCRQITAAARFQTEGTRSSLRILTVGRNALRSCGVRPLRQRYRRKPRTLEITLAEVIGFQCVCDAMNASKSAGLTPCPSDALRLRKVQKALHVPASGPHRLRRFGQVLEQEAFMVREKAPQPLRKTDRGRVVSPALVAAMLCELSEDAHRGAHMPLMPIERRLQLTVGYAVLFEEAGDEHLRVAPIRRRRSICELDE